jgi:alpha-tubulin suppressor-like RCC1 family protein
MGDGTVRCWGRNKDGQLGNGPGADLVRPTPIANIGAVELVALAGSHSCALLKDRSVRCWGSGRILADGQVQSGIKPTVVPNLVGVRLLFGSGLMTCASGESGAPRCWGLSPGEKGLSPNMGQVKVIDIAVASTHGCALLEGGVPKCWGSGDWGSVLAEPKITGAVQLVTGDQFACIMTRDDKVLCWGRNEDGQLGVDPDYETHAAPVQVPVTGVKDLASGEASACALLKDDTIKCWGRNTDGQLGVGKTSDFERPAKVQGLSNVSDMCFSSSHACARTNDHKVFCWGSNTAGQLGDGTKERRLSPIRVTL